MHGTRPGGTHVLLRITTPFRCYISHRCASLFPQVPMKPLLHVLGKALPLSFFAALLAATQVEGEGPVQALAVAVGGCAAGYFGAWAAHFLSYPRRYGRKAVLAAARSLSWLALAFPLTVATV